MIAPTLHTARLTLRMVTKADWPAYRAYRLSPRSTVLPVAQAEALARTLFDDFTDHWRRHGFGRFIMVERASGTAIGHVGPLLGEGHPEPELTWTIWSPAHEGKGYAFEAAEATRRYAFNSLGWSTAVSYIAQDNARSRALAERLGARLDNQAAPLAYDQPYLVYRHPAPWEAAPTGPAVAIVTPIAAAVPTLTTARLRLRAPRNDDFALYAQIAATADGTDPMEPATRKALWLDYAQMAAGWLLRGAGVWAIERRADGALVGFLPLNHEQGDPELEIGWFLATPFRGHGYATEAARAGLAFAFGALARPSLVSYVDPANTASAAVARRLGGEQQPDLQDGCLVFRHPCPPRAAP